MTGEVTELVLVGGGHSHLEVLRLFSRDPPRSLRLTLVSDGSETLYSGMLPGYLAGRYAHDECHIDLRLAARAADCRFLRARAVGIDVPGKRILCGDRPPVGFDIASIDIGSVPRKTGISGAQRYGLPIRPVADFLRGWEAVTERALGAAGEFSIVVVGAGAGGVETVLALRHCLLSRFEDCGRSGRRVRFLLLNDAEVILPAYSPRARRKLERILDRHRIEVHTGCRVVEVLDGEIRCRPQAGFGYDALIWVTGPAPAPWISESALRTDARGFILVDECLRSVSHPEIFAAGDIATMAVHPRPKSGVMAVRQGPPLARNLRAAARNRPLSPFAPQRRFLSIIGTGERYAVAARAGLAVEGAWVWRWKEHIDRKWVTRHREAALARLGSRNGGGFSVAPEEILSTVLSCRDGEIPSVHPVPPYPDSRPSSGPAGRLLRQDVDFFHPVVEDPYLLGMLAAQHSLGRLFAAGAAFHGLLATVNIGVGPGRDRDVRELAEGINRVLCDAGFTLSAVTAHHGGQPGLLLSCHGAMDTGSGAVRLHRGQSLILTKPLGVGTLFAAERNGKAKGRWIDAALDSMLRSNQAAAAILAAHHATGCVTAGSSGLLEPLITLCRNSGVGAVLHIDALPALEGATVTARMGLVDPRQGTNQRLQYGIANLEETRDHDCFPLLFDPQLSGGLLGAVPERASGPCLDALRQAGCQAALIGRVTTMGSEQTPVTLLY